MSAYARPRAAALVSGQGGTALNLIELDREGELEATLALVVAHREEIPAVARCRALGVPVEIVVGPPSDATSDQLDAILTKHGIDLVLLCGYLRHFRVGGWAGRVLNIHPALLPKFGGKGMHGQHVHEAVLASGETESGCSVHLVDDEYDHGEVILQRRVALTPADTAASLSERVRAAEKIAYPEAIARWVARERD